MSRSLSVVVSAAVLMAALMLAGSADAASGNPAPDSTYVTNGPVSAVVHSGGKTYIGGTFSQVGPRTGPGVGISRSTGSDARLPSVSGGNSRVYAVVGDGSGGWYIGGDFTHVGGIARANIAHVRADKTVDPVFDPHADQRVTALAVSGRTVYAGGYFASIGGQTLPRPRFTGHLGEQSDHAMAGWASAARCARASVGVR